LLVTGIGLIIDQITKFYIDHAMPLYALVPVIDNFFSITYVRIPGAAFGLFAESGFRIPFLTGVSMIAFAAILVACTSRSGLKCKPSLPFHVSLPVPAEIWLTGSASAK
jgi:lipoprotein signal peptidase